MHEGLRGKEGVQQKGACSNEAECDGDAVSREQVRHFVGDKLSPQRESESDDDDAFSGLSFDA